MIKFLGVLCLYLGVAHLIIAQNLYHNQNQGSKELVIISPDITDAVSYLPALNDLQDYIILESNIDNRSQLNDYFASRENSKCHAVHVFCYGNARGLMLNRQMINPDELDVLFWNKISENLSGNKDILFYVCNLLEDKVGQELISRIAYVTKANVALWIDHEGDFCQWELMHTEGDVYADMLLVDNMTMEE